MKTIAPDRRLYRTASVVLRFSVAVSLAGALSQGCSAPAHPVAQSAPPAAPVHEPVVRPVVPVVPESAPLVETKPVGLPFIEDDFAGAKSEAARRGVPLFVDVWASWCHSCMSMKEVVFLDPALLRLKDDFVWLSIDSEKEENATFLDRFPAKSLPTLWVLDEKTEAPLFKWIGAATADEVGALLEDATKSASSEHDRTNPTAGDATLLWMQGNRASALGHAEEAVNFYRRAFHSSSNDWSRRPNVLEALSARLRELGRTRDALDLATKEAEAMPPGTPRVNVVLNGIDAAASLSGTSAGRAGLASLTRLAVRIAEDSAEPILLDDRSSLFLSLVSILKQTNAAESRRLATEWAGFLEAEAGRDEPERRRVWDSHRLEAYLALGQPERAIVMLEQSERETPDDYNPPARLARAYLAMGRADLAESAVSRALDRSTGPRKIRIYMLDADILLAEKKSAAARTVLAEALAFAQKEKLAAQYAGLRQVIAERLRAMR